MHGDGGNRRIVRVIVLSQYKYDASTDIFFFIFLRSPLTTFDRRKTSVGPSFLREQAAAKLRFSLDVFSTLQI